jgi:large subunit ribosomal protein L9
MKVLLKEDVDHLGYAGEVHTVADGYGRNYLLPKGLAVRATANELKQANAWRKRAETRRAELRAEYEVLAERIDQLTLTFTARAGDTGKLYGSITTGQVADELNKALGTEIDRRKVGTEPLRQLGEHQVVVRLSGDFQPALTVMVQPEGRAPIASAEAAATAAPAAAGTPDSSIETEDEEVLFEEEELAAGQEA